MILALLFLLAFGVGVFTGIGIMWWIARKLEQAAFRHFWMGCLLLSMMPACAADLHRVNLAWDSPPEPHSIVFHASTNRLTATNLSTAQFRLNIGATSTARVTLYPGRYWFALTATNSNGESAPALIAVESRLVWQTVTNN